MSWEQLLAITREADEEAERGLDVGDVACPNDGTPLVVASDGMLFCPFDGWTRH